MQSIVADSFDTTSLLGSQLGLSVLLPVAVEEHPELTLNNHLNIAVNANTLNGEVPKLRYFGVGIGGSYNADDSILVSAYNPARTDMNLYRLIPIRCRPVDEDLSDSERSKYRLRQRKTLADGNEYFLYYLKVLNYDEGVKFKSMNFREIINTQEHIDFDRDEATKEPTEEDMDIIYEKWRGYVDKFLEIIVIEASQNVKDAIVETIYEYGRNDVDVLMVSPE